MTHDTDSTTFNEFHSRLRDQLEERKASRRPLLVTSNGETKAVVLSPALFDELMDQAEMAQSLALLDRSVEDIKAGRTRPAKSGIRQIANELNLNLDR